MRTLTKKAVRDELPDCFWRSFGLVQPKVGRYELLRVPYPNIDMHWKRVSERILDELRVVQCAASSTHIEFGRKAHGLKGSMVRKKLSYT